MIVVSSRQNSGLDYRYVKCLDSKCFPTVTKNQFSTSSSKLANNKKNLHRKIVVNTRIMLTSLG